MTILVAPSIIQTDAGVARNTDIDTDQSRAMFGSIIDGGVGGQFAHVQLFNPAASGVVVWVDKLILTSPSSQQVELGLHNTALASLGSFKGNKNFGAAAPAAEVRGQPSAVPTGTVYGVVGVDADQSPTTIEFKRPIRLDAGEGFIQRARTLATVLVVTWEWREFLA